MSRIGKKPIIIEKDVNVSKDTNNIEVSGPKGKLTLSIVGDIEVNINDNEIVVNRKNDQKQNKALHGLYRALLFNMVKGVTDGFVKKLVLVGIGFKAELNGEFLVLHVGYSHPIIFRPPTDIKLEVPTQNSIIISGIDNQLVGLVAAKIRSFRKPEPYKGKGIKYDNEKIRRKAGKSAVK
jgi:large subunit ribosomal protein L6